MEVYEIIKQTKYNIQTRAVPIEECGDEFLTRDDLDDLGVSPYGTNHNFNDRVKESITSYLKRIPKGKKSIIIDDEELIDFLKDSYWPISHFVKGTRRTGNRLFKHNKLEKKKANFKDWKSLIKVFETYYVYEYKIEVKIKRDTKNKRDVINTIRKLATWENLERTNNRDLANKKRWSIPKDEMKWVKNVYENPLSFKNK